MAQGFAADTTKEQVKRATDIVELVGQYIPLRREGRGFKGICPWHDDSRPSLQVNPDRQFYRCFVCNIGGDVFDFVMRHDQLTFPEALAMLAQRAGIPIERTGGPDEQAKEDRQLLYQTMAWAEQQFYDCLLGSTAAGAARGYFESRGITRETIDRFRLGYAPDRWDWLLAQAKDTRFTPQVLERAGLAVQRSGGPGYYDRFRGRVLFSIRDPQGRPVGVGGRVLPGSEKETAKYINSPESPLFSKSSLLYGLDAARDSIGRDRTVLVMEGYTDCLIAIQCGFTNSVAVLGTALGERHLRLLRRYADRVVLVLDGDEAGRRRTDEILELFVAEQMDLRILTLPDNLDPADFLLQRGAPAFRTLVDDAVDALEHKFKTATSGVDATSFVHDANRAVEEVLATLAKAPRPRTSAQSGASLREAQVLGRLALRFGVPQDRLRARLSELRSGGARPARTNREGNREQIVSAAAAPVPAGLSEDERRRHTTQRWLLEILIQSPESLPRVRGVLAPEAFVCPLLKTLYGMCCTLADAGQVPSFERLMLASEDSQIQCLLAELDDAHQAKKRSQRSAELDELLAAYLNLELEQQNRLRRTAAARPSVSETEQVDVLRHIIGEKRRRLGISAPMDG